MSSWYINGVFFSLSVNDSSCKFACTFSFFFLINIEYVWRHERSLQWLRGNITQVPASLRMPEGVPSPLALAIRMINKLAEGKHANQLKLAKWRMKKRTIYTFTRSVAVRITSDLNPGFSVQPGRGTAQRLPRTETCHRDALLPLYFQVTSCYPADVMLLRKKTTLSFYMQ